MNVIFAFLNVSCGNILIQARPIFDHAVGLYQKHRNRMAISPLEARFLPDAENMCPFLIFLIILWSCTITFLEKHY